MRHLATLHYSHSGKLRPHTHTAYLPLGAILILVGLILLGYTGYAADFSWTRPSPEAGSIGLSGTVPGKPPTVAAVITEPTNGQRFTSSPVTVKGTCPLYSLVQIFKNDIFAGSTACSSSRTFSLEVDLLNGQNSLTATVYDALNQQGPTSSAVAISYDLIAAQSTPLTSLNFGGEQLLVNTNSVYRGTFPGQEIAVPVDILGGRAPYAINIQWGDSTNKMLARNDNATFYTPHTYQKPGTYQLGVQATDADGRVAFLTVAVIVNGATTTTAGGSAGGAGTDKKTLVESLLVLWPLYVSIFAVVVSYWVGEWREKRLLQKQGKLIPHYR